MPSRPATRPTPGLPGPRCDVAGLRAFVAVARLRTVGRAARALARTQPSISARLAALEAAWTTRLFRRGPRGMHLTPEGARLLPLAEAALGDLERLDRAAGLPASAAAELRIGSGDALGRERVPRALVRLLRERPGLEVHLREGPRHHLLDLLRDGEIDLALVVRPAAAPAPAGIETEPILESEIHVLAPRGELGPRRRAVPLARLAGRRLVLLQPGSGFRLHVEAALVAQSIVPVAAVEVGNLSLARRFVAAGLGIAPVPAVAFGDERDARVDRLVLSGVPNVVYERALRAGVPAPPPAARLVELLRQGAAPR